MQVNKFQFISVDEKNSGIKYHGVENKGARPYLVVRTDIKQGYFLAVPLTDAETIKGEGKNPGYYWLRYFFAKESFIKLDHLVLFKNEEIGKSIKLVNKYLDSNLKKLTIKKLINFIQYDKSTYEKEKKDTL